jgi:predicted nucleic acid-binding protein
MKVLLDTNILLDVLLDREPWVADSKAIWKACDDGKIMGYVSGTSFTNVYYIARRLVGAHGALEAVSLLLDAFEVAPIGRDVLERACQLSGSDFEDDVVIAAALRLRLDAIVTRDRAGFASAQIRVLAPAELLASLT